MLGAWLAGVLFAAGVTFATLSIVNKNASGAKQQVEPLASEQEILMSSVDASEKDNRVGEVSNVVTIGEESIINDRNEDNETGTSENFTPTNVNGDVSESRYGDMQDLESSLSENIKSVGEGVIEIKRASTLDDLEVAKNVDNLPLFAGLSNSTHELPTYEDGFSHETSKSDDLGCATTFDMLESDIGKDVNADGTVTLVGLTSVNTASTNAISNNLEETINSNSETPSQFLGEFESQVPSNSITPDAKRIDSDEIDYQFSFEDVVANVSLLKDQDIEQNNMLQLPAKDCTECPIVHDKNETVPIEKLFDLVPDHSEEQMLQFDSISSAGGHNLNDSDLASVQSVVVSTDPTKKEPDLKCDNETERNSLFESLLPKKSFSHSGIPAPSLVYAAQQVPPGKILVPAFVDQVQGHALAALQVLKVIEVDAQPGDLCTRREYARWLVTASNVFSRNTFSKVYPAMYIENLTELAFDDVTPKDPDFPFIQGLAEAGLISSKLSRSDLDVSVNILDDYVLFSPDSPLSRQDLISWKMALERRQLPEVDKNHLYQCTGYIDVDKINPDAWPALIADFAGGEQGITALAFGYTRLFQPDKPVTKAQAAIAIATGDAAEVVGEELARIEAESLAETAVNAHTTLVAQVEKDLNASFEEELAKERQKTKDLEKLAEEARLELNRLRTQREEEKNALITSHATVESEMEVLSRLRHEVEEQLQNLMSNKLEISFERDRMNKLRKEVESENQVIIRLQYELEVERKALIMARSWAEEEAKRAREQAKALEEARERWERHGIKIVVDGDLQDDASIGTTWLIAGDQPPVDETIGRGETLVKKLKEMAAEMKHRSSVTIEKIIQRIVMIISALKQWVSVASNHATELRIAGISKAKNAMIEFKESASGFSLVIVDKARRVVADCKGSVGKISQKFKA
uniref:SLH domain-containing protein n=2 Tax=Musa acuminata subsp. malaccensis TaxID=214687 RepID=A0A804J3J4_MUSAM|nr:PREDICTED: uncharacterized protein LOC103984483 isoform X3 [Musa acuminata subsp. malaccensis]XP_009400261.1 PREDICTED: uncharacterized protein LOC103984483 isoform X3 [Musa acuminata subsp. malaccensis]